MAHALILGVSGISGWSILNQIRNYPTPKTFARITGTTNRPFSLQQARIPPDPRISLVSSIDFTKTIEEVEALLREKIKDVHTISHVFFTAYIQTSDFESLKQVNTTMLDVAVRAIERVAPSLKVVILQTGGKGYGLEFPKEVKISPPLKENMPRIPEPYRSKIFYYTQYDLLQKLSEGKSWTFTEIRPDGIVGFVPGSNAMNMAQGIALYLSLYKKVYGTGAAVPFPGSEHGYHSTHSDTFQDLLARMEIFAATNIEKCGDGRVFNIADGATVTWSMVWPGLCKYFSLLGIGPVPGSQPMEDFVNEHASTWDRVVEEHGLNKEAIREQNWGHVHFMMVQFDFNREYDLSNARRVGFIEEIDTIKGYTIAWDRMREAKIFP